MRRLGDVNFVVLRDRSGVCQAVLTPDEFAPVDGLQAETVVALEGDVVAEPKAPGGCELHHVRVSVISPVTEPLPFALSKKVKVSQPVFLDHAVVGHRHLRQRAILRLAAGIMRAFRATLDAQEFVEIQTPKFVASATESGASVFSVEYFGQTAYLAQSPQFYKQIMVGVFERVYEVAPVFRAEKHNTIRHLNEYVSLDVEFGFIENHFTVMALLSGLIRSILDHLREAHKSDLDLLEASMPVVGDKIPHIHFTDAQQLLIDRYKAKDVKGEPDLAPEHERLLGQWAQEEHKSDFLFVTGYPMSKRPFYTHPDPERPQYAAGFDLLFRGLELVTGGQRLHRYEDYLAASKARGYDIKPFETYFEAFRYGMPPHGGFAIGLERFLMQMLGYDNIRAVTLFPRDVARLTP
jgi:nondiscriminating aspartyl-tRNA synthetase